MKKRIVILLMIVLLASCAVSAAADEKLPVSYEPVTFYLFNMEISQRPHDDIMENVIFCTHYMRNGRCVKCGYIKDDSGLPEEEKKYYGILLNSIQQSADPMENDEFVKELRKRFEAQGMKGKYAWEADAVIQALNDADELYRNLYLLSVFNYNAKINTKGVGSYSVDKNRLEVSKDSAINKGTFLATFFHESGHGIEMNLWEFADFDLFTNSIKSFDTREKSIDAALYQDVENTIRRTIDETLDGSEKDLQLPEEDIQEIINALINDNSDMEQYTGGKGTGTIESWGIRFSSLEALYLEVKKSIGVDLDLEILYHGISEDYNNLLMASDILTGMMNNKVVGQCAHFTKNYWWMYGERTHNMVTDSWAEFFAAKLMKNEDCIEVNEIFFPKATQELEDFANELYDYYLDYYTDVMERQNQ